MKPPPFDYRRPDSVEEALADLSTYGGDSAILAGGQSLIPLLNLRFARPDVVIDINRIAGLDDVQINAESVVVGALTRARDLERHAEVKKVLPVLAQAISQVAHPQIRHRTTIGGNISHADPSSELPGVLAALDGSIRLISESGTREVPWDQFFETVFTTAKRTNEMVSEVIFPRCEGWSFVFNEVARRQGDYPLTGLCTGLLIRDGHVLEARLAAVAVSDRPVRLVEAEAALVGVAVDDEVALRSACRAAAECPEPMTDLHGSGDYRRGLLVTLTRRSVLDLAAEHAA